MSANYPIELFAHGEEDGTFQIFQSMRPCYRVVYCGTGDDGKFHRQTKIFRSMPPARKWLCWRIDDERDGPYCWKEMTGKERANTMRRVNAIHEELFPNTDPPFPPDCRCGSCGFFGFLCERPDDFNDPCPECESSRWGMDEVESVFGGSR